MQTNRQMAAAASSSSATQSLPASRKRLTLVATILGSSIAVLDSSVVSVALPSIQHSLGGGLAGQQWVSNAYLLTLGSLILLGGSLGDIFGERRVFALGVGGFGAASLLCALAPSIELDHELAGQPLTPRGHAAIAQAKQLTLGRPSVAGLPAHEAAAITVASGQSSLQAFRVGIGVAGALVIIGGLIGAVGIRNPKRIVRAGQCPGGQLAGAPLDAAGLHASQAA